MRLVLLRHGETTLGPHRYLGSRCDPGLSGRGREQALAARVLLERRPLRAVVSSPLRRAMETARLACPDASLHVDERLCELDFGSLSGWTWGEIVRSHALLADAWRRTQWPPLSDAETPADFFGRVIAAGIDLADAHGELDDVLVVCHGGPIRALVGTARGTAPLGCWRIRAAHGQLRTVRAGPHTPERWRQALRSLIPAG